MPITETGTTSGRVVTNQKFDFQHDNFKKCIRCSSGDVKEGIGVSERDVLEKCVWESQIDS